MRGLTAWLVRCFLLLFLLTRVSISFCFEHYILRFFCLFTFPCALQTVRRGDCEPEFVACWVFESDQISRLNIGDIVPHMFALIGWSSMVDLVLMPHLSFSLMSPECVLSVSSLVDTVDCVTADMWSSGWEPALMVLCPTHPLCSALPASSSPLLSSSPLSHGDGAHHAASKVRGREEP